MNDILISIVGYIGSGFLATALFINQTLRFRWVSAAGSFTFLIYGILIGAFPVIITNCILLSINIYKIITIYNLKEVFEFMEIKKGNEFVDRFLKKYKEDINSYFPDFEFMDDTNRICFLVLRDLVIANIFVAKIEKEGNIFVEINYTVPKYRDYKVGKFIFDKGKQFLISKGITRIIYTHIDNQQHKHFLMKTGFKNTIENGVRCFTKGL